MHIYISYGTDVESLELSTSPTSTSILEPI